MKIILAEPQHLADICRITEQAKAQLENMGLDQWQKGYPSRDVWEKDIACGGAWIAVEGESILAAFAYQTSPDLSYYKIDGQWLTDLPYASMHRVCVADGCKGKGVAGKLFAHGFAMAQKDGFSSMRIDTHHDNLPMRKALEKAGFQACGTIILVGGSEDGDPRVAYEKVLR